MTGMPVTSSVLQKDVVINGTRWSYRCAEGKEGFPTVVFLHGILSSSYSYRKVIDLLGQEGYNCVAPDWPGHGDSDVPASGKFNYAADDYLHGLEAFLYKLNVKENYILVTQGFILGQYGLLYALKNKESIDKLVVLNTPLEKKTQLPGIVKKLKGADGGVFGGLFGGGGGGSSVAEIRADTYCGLGGPYLMPGDDAVVYQEPFLKQEYRDSASKLMENVDYQQLVEEIDTRYRTFKTETLLAYGTSDRYMDWNTATDWLDDKRTCMKLFTFPDKIGHFAQEDYPERVADTILKFIAGENVEIKGDLSKFN
jgi:pimeloyl-ACP methyl ester carboxylesterase